ERHDDRERTDEMPAAAELGHDIGGTLAERAPVVIGRCDIAADRLLAREAFDHLAFEIGYLAALARQHVFDVAGAIGDQVLAADRGVRRETGMIGEHRLCDRRTDHAEFERLMRLLMADRAVRAWAALVRACTALRR